MFSLKEVRVIDPILTTIVQGYNVELQLSGDVLFPQVPVNSAGGKVIEFGLEAFRLMHARRAPGSATKRISLGYSGKDYVLVQESLEGIVPREHLRDAATVPGIDLGGRVSRNALRTLRTSLEWEQATLATTSGNYGANTVNAAGDWSEPAIDPVISIDVARAAIRAKCGVDPNTLVLSPKAGKALKTNAKIIDRFKYTAPAIITDAMLALLLNFPTIVTANAVAANDSNVFVDLWGNNAILAYVAPAGQRNQEQPSFGYTYTMQGHPYVEKNYYENNIKSWIYPVTYERAPVLSGIASGYLIQNPSD